MKQILILLTCLFGTTQVFSQEKAHIAISSGLSLPLSNYGSSDLNNEKAGLAKTGYAIDLSGYYRINQHFGLAGLIRHQRNGLNEDVVKAVFSPFTAGGSLDFKSNPWRINSYMIGLNGSVPINNKLSWESKLLIGASTVTPFDMELTMNFMGSTETMKSEGQASTNVSLLLGSGLKYDLNDKFLILGNADFWITETQPKTKGTQSDGSTSIESGPYMNITSINLSLGLAYKL